MFEKLHNIYDNIKKRKKINCIRVNGFDKTFFNLITKNCSLARFGDGELTIINGAGIGFQEYDAELSERLKEILYSESDKSVLICLPGCLDKRNKRDYNKGTVNWWENYKKIDAKNWLKYINKNNNYYNTDITRLFMSIDDIDVAAKRFVQMMSVFEDKKIVIIEGAETHMGEGNNLLENAEIIDRIICPAENAYREYDNILSKALRYDREVMFLIALGPTATVLAYDLSKKGYRALDVGHLDIEYEWFLRNDRTKSKIPNKYTNEARNKN